MPTILSALDKTSVKESDLKSESSSVKAVFKDCKVESNTDKQDLTPRMDVSRGTSDKTDTGKQQTNANTSDIVYDNRALEDGSGTMVNQAENLLNRDVEDDLRNHTQTRPNSSNERCNDGIANAINVVRSTKRGFSLSSKENLSNPQESNTNKRKSRIKSKHSESRFKRSISSMEEYIDYDSSLPSIKSVPITSAEIRKRQLKSRSNRIQPIENASIREKQKRHSQKNSLSNDSPLLAPNFMPDSPDSMANAKGLSSPIKPKSSSNSPTVSLHLYMLLGCASNVFVVKDGSHQEAVVRGKQRLIWFSDGLWQRTRLARFPFGASHHMSCFRFARFAVPFVALHALQPLMLFYCTL